MNILFLTSPQNKEECSYYSEYITHYGGTCIIYENQNDFFETIETYRFKPELLVLDYEHFNHLILNVYNYLKNSYRCFIPAVFFNDPYLQNEEYIDYWHETLDMIYTDKSFSFNNYKNHLMLLANAIKSYKKERGYIKKVENATNTTDTVKLGLNAPEYSHEHFFCEETASQLSSAGFLLYNELVKKAPETVSIEELTAAIKKNAKTPSRNTVVCLISRIRTALRTTGGKTYDIIKSDAGYKLIKRTFM